MKLVAAAMLVSSLLSAGRVTAPERMTVAVQPTPTNVQLGREVQGHFRVYNFSKAPLVVGVRTTGLLLLPDGRTQLTGRTLPLESAIIIATPHLTIAPHHSATVDFSFVPPKGTGPGLHELSFIVVPQPTSAQLRTRAAVGALWPFRVPGVPNGTLQAAWVGPHLTFANVGRSALRVSSNSDALRSYTSETWASAAATPVLAGPILVAPHSYRVSTIAWPLPWYGVGHRTTRVIIDYRHGALAVASIIVSGSYWVISWYLPLIAGVLLGLCLLRFALCRYRRRRRAATALRAAPPITASAETSLAAPAEPQVTRAITHGALPVLIGTRGDVYLATPIRDFCMSRIADLANEATAMGMAEAWEQRAGERYRSLAMETSAAWWLQNRNTPIPQLLGVGAASGGHPAARAAQ